MSLLLLLTLKEIIPSRTVRSLVDIVNRVALVVGPADYCGVNKKTMFTVMNYVLPSKGQLSMHCSANVGADDDSAILFGLSGTAKPRCLLILTVS